MDDLNMITNYSVARPKKLSYRWYPYTPENVLMLEERAVCDEVVGC